MSERNAISRRRTTTGIVAAGIATAAMLRGVTRRFEILEDSMAPHLQQGDWIIAWKRTGTPVRGDIVVFSRIEDPGTNLVKRVIGLPGEHVEVRDGRVHINDAILADRWAIGTTSPHMTVLVPEGFVWVLGDNRGASTSDSRTHGTVPVAGITWKIGFRYSPRSRIGIVR